MPLSQFSEIEQELKIKLSLRDLEHVFQVLTRKPRVRNAVQHKFLPRAYYDTKDLQLYRKGISLRVQYKPGKQGKIGSYEQTLKYDLGVMPVAAGVLYRKEIKDVLPDPVPNIARFKGPEARAMTKPFRAKRFIHIFTASIERRSVNLKIGNGKKRGEVEVAFDVGVVVLPDTGKYYAFYEIEIEHKGGNPAAIETLQKKIMRMARSAKIQPLSKAQQGSRLYQKSARYKNAHK